jgi:hypothetical protein
MATPLTLIIRYISTAFSGCVLMMWGVINFTLQLRLSLSQSGIQDGGATGAVESGWGYSWLMAALTSLVPFVAGVVLLRGVFKEANRARQLMG